MGAARPHIPRQGMIPWTRNCGNFLVRRKYLVPAVAFKATAKHTGALSLSGTAAKGRQTGCFASGENTGKWPGERPPISQVGKNPTAWQRLFPWHFRLFSLCPKACYISSQRSTRSFLGYIHQAASRGVGPGPQALAQSLRPRRPQRSLCSNSSLYLSLRTYLLV